MRKQIFKSRKEEKELFRMSKVVMCLCRKADNCFLLLYSISKIEVHVYVGKITESQNNLLFRNI